MLPISGANLVEISFSSITCRWHQRKLVKTTKMDRRTEENVFEEGVKLVISVICLLIHSV